LFTLIPAEENFEVFGLDFSLAMVKEAKKKGVKVILGDAHHLPIKEKAFNAVMFFTSLEFLDENQALNEAQRILKNHGWLILGVHNRLNPWNLYRKIKAKFKKDSVYKTIKYYSASSLKKLLRKKSFKIEFISTCVFLPLNSKLEYFLEKLDLKIGALLVVKAKLQT